MHALRQRLQSPLGILLAALALFVLYAWPGYIGWDARDHLVQARLPSFSDGHPPFVILLVRICDFFVRGPALILLVQAVSLLVGLWLLFSSRLRPVPAALASAGVFLFPPIAGVTALIAKDGMMAGFLMIAIAMLVRGRPGWGIAFTFLAALMRWNSLPATFAPVLLLFCWAPSIRGLKRYAIALAAWIAVTVVAYEANAVLADRHEYFWYWSSAYQDIAGTIEYANLDDATLDHTLAETPLRFHDRLNERFRAVYKPFHYFQLMRDGEGRLWDPPATEQQRDAIATAWKAIVLENPAAYLRYRWDNFRYLNQIDHPETFSNVYVWFTVFAAPETIAELHHDAWPSRIQDKLQRAAIWFSLTPIYWVFWYFALCFLLLPFARRRALEAALLLSAIGYQLSYFFLAQTTDYRYSSWMEVCAIATAVLVGVRLVQRRRASRRTDSGESDPAA
ncbi:MAG TPA: hypothetical protein VGJ29_06715 [Vicinamibacterales bacterium]